MEKSGYVDVDELQARTSLEEAAAKCGVRLDAKAHGAEARIDCPFSCPGDHAGRREVSISTDNPQKVFYCHAYQCQLRGNLLALMHGWLTGQRPSGGKLKGAEFNRVKSLLAGTTAPQPPAELAAPVAPAAVAAPKRTVPLEDSEDEAIRKLATIDEKFVTDVAAMHPAAASYVRRHPCLSPESMRKWRVGYLPLDGGGDKRGWSLRGHILYPIQAEDGKVLAWIGRDPAFEEKDREFLRLLPDERAKERPPQKHKVPAGFARGSQLFGQQAVRLQEPGYREFVAKHGIIVVEGFNDVIGLDSIGIPAIGLCSNRMTDEQAEKIDRFARHLAGGKVTLLLDCDEHGDDGAKEALWSLTQRALNVRLGWTRGMHGGRFAGRQPESLTLDEWAGDILG
jgi:hypothetical protein